MVREHRGCRFDPDNAPRDRSQGCGGYSGSAANIQGTKHRATLERRVRCHALHDERVNRRARERVRSRQAGTVIDVSRWQHGNQIVSAVSAGEVTGDTENPVVYRWRRREVPPGGNLRACLDTLGQPSGETALSNVRNGTLI